MSKWYDVKCVIVKSIMVEVEDDMGEDEALSIASNEEPDFDTLDVSPILPENVEAELRHADVVSSLPDN